MAEPEQEEPGRDNDDVIDVEAEPMLPMAVGMVGAIDRAQVDVQIATAKRYPRSIDKAIKESIMLATTDQDIARTMFYVLPRKDKDGNRIQGPSVRLAEVMGYSWTNLRCEGIVEDVGPRVLTAAGTCFDLERNVAFRVRVSRRIVNKHGERYNDDMIQQTSNAAIALATRNAVFKVIPLSLVKRVYEQAKKASLGPENTFKDKRKNALEWFEQKGMKNAQVFAMLGVNGADDIGADELIELHGLRTAVETGETTVDEIAGRNKPQSDGTEELRAEIVATLYKNLTGKLTEAKTTEQVAQVEAELKAKEKVLSAAQLSDLAALIVTAKEALA